MRPCIVSIRHTHVQRARTNTCMHTACVLARIRILTRSLSLGDTYADNGIVCVPSISHSHTRTGSRIPAGPLLRQRRGRQAQGKVNPQAQPETRLNA